MTMPKVDPRKEVVLEVPIDKIDGSLHLAVDEAYIFSLVRALAYQGYLDDSFGARVTKCVAGCERKRRSSAVVPPRTENQVPR